MVFYINWEWISTEKCTGVFRFSSNFSKFQYYWIYVKQITIRHVFEPYTSICQPVWRLRTWEWISTEKCTGVFRFSSNFSKFQYYWIYVKQITIRHVFEPYTSICQPVWRLRTRAEY